MYCVSHWFTILFCSWEKIKFLKFYSCCFFFIVWWQEIHVQFYIIWKVNQSFRLEKGPSFLNTITLVQPFLHSLPCSYCFTVGALENTNKSLASFPFPRYGKKKKKWLSMANVALAYPTSGSRSPSCFCSQVFSSLTQHFLSWVHAFELAGASNWK